MKTFLFIIGLIFNAFGVAFTLLILVASVYSLFHKLSPSVEDGIMFIIMIISFPCITILLKNIKKSIKKEG